MSELYDKFRTYRAVRQIRNPLYPMDAPVHSGWCHPREGNELRQYMSFLLMEEMRKPNGLIARLVERAHA